MEGENFEKNENEIEEIEENEEKFDEQDEKEIEENEENFDETNEEKQVEENKNVEKQPLIINSQETEEDLIFSPKQIEEEEEEEEENQEENESIEKEEEKEKENNEENNGKPNWYTPIEEIDEKVKLLKKTFFTQKPTTKSFIWRVEQLKRLKRMIEDKKKYWIKALKADLQQTDFMCLMSLKSISNEVDYAIKNLKDWMKPEEKSDNQLLTFPSEVKVFREPFGTVLIISPWNYPLQLVFKPLIGAIAAGNCCVIKPSEISSSCSKLIGKLLPQFLDTSCFTVIQGGVEETTKLLENRFDHIFYTGNPTVGKIIMQKASKYLTPVTLELGGKCPVYIHEDSNLDIVSNRILWAKTINCGQTCISPDYVLVHKSLFKKLQEKFIKTLNKFFGEDWEEIRDNKMNLQSNINYSRIISKRHTKRLKSLLDEIQNKNYLKFISGKFVDVENNFFAPTIVCFEGNETEKEEFLKSKVMEEEIFGPILPVFSVENEFEALQFIVEREKPLATYLFTKNKNIQQTFILNSSEGAISINECLIHFTIPEAPFGGVGNSGMGNYNGFYSFKTFSHEKTVLIKSQNTLFDAEQKYPPYNKKKLNFLETVSDKKSNELSAWVGLMGAQINFLLPTKK